MCFGMGTHRHAFKPLHPVLVDETMVEPWVQTVLLDVVQHVRQSVKLWPDETVQGAVASHSDPMPVSSRFQRSAVKNQAQFTAAETLDLTLQFSDHTEHMDVSPEAIPYG